MAVMAELGVVDRLIAEHPGQLEWHAPWHATHTADALLRGRVDPLAVDAWLAERGGRLADAADNGAIPATSRMTLATSPVPPRVFHLMPRGISKGAAIAWDLERRGLEPADAVAIGDSVSDLDMAPAVDRLWITANGAAVDGMAGLLAAVPNVSVDRRRDGRGLGPGGTRQPLVSRLDAPSPRGWGGRGPGQDVTSRRPKWTKPIPVSTAM